MWSPGEDHGALPASFGRVVGLLLVAVAVGVIIMKLMAPRMKLPPGPLAFPIVGNWFQVCAISLSIQNMSFTDGAVTWSWIWKFSIPLKWACVSGWG